MGLVWMGWGLVCEYMGWNRGCGGWVESGVFLEASGLKGKF